MNLCKLLGAPAVRSLFKQFEVCESVNMAARAGLIRIPYTHPIMECTA